MKRNRIYFRFLTRGISSVRGNQLALKLLFFYIFQKFLHEMKKNVAQKLINNLFTFLPDTQVSMKPVSDLV